MSDPVKVRAALAAGICAECERLVDIDVCPACARCKACGHEVLCRFKPISARSLREMVERPANPFAASLGSDPGDERT
jgi:hypothetical protein